MKEKKLMENIMNVFNISVPFNFYTRSLFRLNALFLLLISLSSCHDSKSHDLEDYGDLSNSPTGIALNDPEKHVGGWGRRDCLLCHNAALNIHRASTNIVDAETLNQLIRENGLSTYCLKCHGPNGIQ